MLYKLQTDVILIYFYCIYKSLKLQYNIFYYLSQKMY